MVMGNSFGHPAADQFHPLPRCPLSIKPHPQRPRVGGVVIQVDGCIELLFAKLDKGLALGEVLVLRHIEGLDWSEVAERMGRSRKAVGMLWTRALRAVRPHLEEPS